MKKYIIILLTALMMPQMTMAASIEISANSETKNIEAAVDIGRAEKSVSAAAKVTDSDGNTNYLAQGYTDENGKWSFDYTTDKSGYFDVTAYADGEFLNGKFFVGDTILAEAENFANKTFTSDLISHDSLGGGQMLAVKETADSGKTYEAEYEFETNSEGRYELRAITSAVNNFGTTDYRISVNGGVYLSSSDIAVKIKDFTDYTANAELLKEYSFGMFHLHKGKNTFKIKLDNNDPASGYYVFYADCFKFERKGCEVKDITTNDAAGAYEQGNDITLNINFGDYAVGEEEYEYTVTDFRNTEISNGTAILRKGEYVIPINLGKYDCGWYRFKLYKNNSEAAETTFAVVPPSAERYSGETPFAAEFDSENLAQTNNDRRKMAKAAKLAGVQWVREHTSLNGFSAEENSEQYYKEINKNADIMHENGLKVISVVSDITNDTSEAYTTQKNLSENTSVDMWELKNDTENTSADMYAAFFKAAALGNAASNTDTKIAMPSQSEKTSEIYNALLMKNDVSAFSDIYNVHTKTTLSGDEQPSMNEQLLKKYIKSAKSNGNIPFWVTESRLDLQSNGNGEISDTQYAEIARYDVISAVQSLAAGTEKHFWTNAVLDKNLNLNPSYQSQAVMAAKLGKAKIKGKLNSSKATGYIFDSGNGDVAVIWAENDTVVNVSASGSVTVTDMMGKSQTVEASGGSAVVNAGKYPVYVTYNGTANNYTEISYNRNYNSEKTYSAAEKIVIKQSFDGANAGVYTLKSGKTATVNLELYNFNDTEKTVTLSGLLCGYTVTPSQENITIPAMQSVTTTATLTPTDKAADMENAALIFSCTTDGKTSSPSAVYVTVSGNGAAVSSNDVTITSGWVGNNIVKAQIVNNKENVGEYVLAAAVYDRKGRLVNTYTEKIDSMAANKLYDVNVRGDMNGYAVKIFAWKSISSLMPVAQSVVLKGKMRSDPDYQKEKIFIEAENYKSATFNAYADTVDGVSGGKLISLYRMPVESGKEYSIDYEFEAPFEGAYAIDLCSSVVQKSWTTDFSISINGEEPVHMGGAAELTSDFTGSAMGDDLMKNYSVGGCYLKEGTNTLKIIVDTNDLVSGSIDLWIDFISFTETDFTFERIESSNGLNVYEADENVKYNFVLNANAEYNYACKYKVTDFWGEVISENKAVISKGKKSAVIDLGMYDLGWYTLEVSDKGKVAAQVHFSVVPELEKRYSGETPFATDICGVYYSKSASDMERLTKTAKLAGITYGRERGNWETFGKSGNTNWSATLGQTPAIKNAGLNVVQHTEQKWFKDGWDTYKDLLAAYDFQQNYVRTADGIIDVVEIDNEADGGLSKVTADDYAAYLKTVFISNADAGSNMRVAMSSLCMSSDNVFNVGLRLNKAIDYTDIFNIHAHMKADTKNNTLGISKEKINEYTEMKMKSTEKDIPVWITEAGLYSVLEAGKTEMTAEQAKYQARYLPTATAEALACGVDKFFWFMWPKFIENNQEMGTFDAQDNPNPSYQAEAICSYMLGKAKYKGLADKENISGYLFDNGTNDVMIIWTSVPQSYDIITETPVTVTDIMGGSHIINPNGGVVSVDIAEYPVYISFESTADTVNYYPCEYNSDTTLKREFTSGERIILQQTFTDRVSSDAHTKGYAFTDGEEVKMILTVNNLNKTEKTISLKGELEGYDVNIKENSVTVPAMSKTQVNVSLKPLGNTEFSGIYDVKRYLKFTAETDGCESSPSVATIRVVNSGKIAQKYPIDGSENIKNFVVNHAVSGAVTDSEVMTDGSYRFGVRFGSTENQWFFPMIRVRDKSKPASSDGIVFMMNGDEIKTGEADIKVFLDMEDDRRYYTGAELLHIVKPGWVQIKFSWDDFILYSSPYGVAEIREFDPSLIKYIEIGCIGYNLSTSEKLNFYIKEPGYFESDNSATAEDGIIFENITDGMKYNAEELSAVCVKLPGNTETAAVMITDEYTDSYTFGGTSLTADLSYLTKGNYTLRVITKDKYGFATSGKVTFFVE